MAALARPISGAMMPSATTPSTAEPGAAVGRGRRRVASWDMLRVLAFVDVASLHIVGKHAFLGIGLPIFLLLALGLGTGKAVSPDPIVLLRRRLRRLILPWLAWSAVYGVVLVATSLDNLAPLASAFDWRMLLYGTRVHLWCRPFAAVAGIAAMLLDRATRSLPTGWLLAAAIPAAAALAGLAPRFEGGHPFDQWVFAAPALPLSLVCGRLLAPCGRRPAIAVVAAATVGLAVLLTAGVAGAPPTLVPGARYALALGLLGIGILFPGAADRWTPRLEPLLLGAYVAHPLVYHQIVARAERLAGLSLGPVAGLLAAIGLTFGLVALLRRTPLAAIM